MVCLSVSQGLHHLRYIAPVATVVVSVTTLLSCVLIAKANNVYLNGLVWPYFSETGRDPPASHIFCLGLNVAAVFIAISWYNNHEFQKTALKEIFAGDDAPTKWTRIAWVCFASGIVSTVGLSMLATFDAAAHPVIHRTGAGWFFGWETLAIGLNTYLSQRLARPATTGSVARNQIINHKAIAKEEDMTGDVDVIASSRLRTFVAQMRLCAVFVVGFIVYIAIGFAINHCDLLTVSDCLAKNLGERYCTTTMRFDETFTTLENCEPKFYSAQIPALGQLVCVLCMIGYTLTFTFHKTHDDHAYSQLESITDDKAIDNYDGC